MNCTTGKISYETRAEARSYLRRSGLSGNGNRPYRCSKCGFWHLGRKIPKHIQRGRRRFLEGRFEDERGMDDAA
jgi:hypothetical protein